MRVLTLHRPSNVDDPGTLRAVLGAIREVSRRLPVVFAVHPRTRAKIEQHGLGRVLETPSILNVPPLGYLEMLGLMQVGAAGAHRLGRDPGGDHGARCSLRHAAREHRAADHRGAGHQHRGRGRTRRASWPRWTTSCARAEKREGCRSCGTAGRRSASRPCCANGSMARPERLVA